MKSIEKNRLLIIAFTLFISVPLFSQTTSEISFEEEVNQELLKITVTSHDKMELTYIWDYVDGVMFKGKEYSLRKVIKIWPYMFYSEQLRAEFLMLIQSAGEEIEKIFLKAFTLYQDRDMNYIQEFKKAVKLFNEYLTSSEEARNKVTHGFRKAITESVIKQVEHNRRVRYWGKNKPIYLGILGGLQVSGDDTISGVCMSGNLGLRFEYFLTNPMKPASAGFSFTLNYLSITGITKYGDNDPSYKYLGVNPMLLLKFFTPSVSYQHNFIIGLGGELNVKISDSGNNSFYSTRGIIMGAVFEVGYRYFSKNFSTTFGFNGYFKIRDTTLVRNEFGRYAFDMGCSVYLGFLL
mgnify:CR=1 FL=1